MHRACIEYSGHSVSGIAISRSRSGKNCEVHQLLQKSQNIVTGDEVGGDARLGMVISKGQHAFPFSMTFPHASECYASSLDRNESESRYLRIHHRKRREVHLLRRLPPSITESTLAIYYTYLLSHSISPQPSCAKRQYLNLDPQVSGLPEPLPWQIDVGLLSGPLLYVNQPIPLIIRLTKLCEENCKSRLNEFQTMLIETTQARAHGSIETLDRFWTVQTVANMKQMLYAGDTSAESVFEIPDCLGFPPTITANDPKFRNMQHQADIRARTSSGLNNWISSSCHSGILRPRLHRGGKIPRDLVAAKFFLTELAKFTASTESRLSRKGLWPWILEGDWLMPRLDGKGHLPTEPVSFVMDAPTRRLGDYVGGCCCRS